MILGGQCFICLKETDLLRLGLHQKSNAGSVLMNLRKKWRALGLSTCWRQVKCSKGSGIREMMGDLKKCEERREKCFMIYCYRLHFWLHFHRLYSYHRLYLFIYYACFVWFIDLLRVGRCFSIIIVPTTRMRQRSFSWTLCDYFDLKYLWMYFDIYQL